MRVRNGIHRFGGGRARIAALLAAVFSIGLLSAGCLREHEATGDAAGESVETVTRAHTRVVWLQDAWDRNDVFSDHGRLRLMAYDSRDGRGERILVPGPAPLLKPLITPCGQKVVYSDGAAKTVRVSDWEGADRRELADGVALAVWRAAPESRTWVYVARGETALRGNAQERVVRIALDDPRHEEPVWDQAPVGRDNFQLAADGRRAAGMFPWPDCGIADLEAGTWERHGRGCWTAMAPDRSYRMWMLDGAHRALTLISPRDGQRWNVPLAEAPAISGHEVYHPRWSNHPRFMTMTGPYKIRHGGNNIRGGGEAVEVHIGRFSADYRAIEAWVQLTDNPHANFFPDVWLAGVPAELLAARGDEADSGEAAEPGTAPEEALVKARLIEAAPIPAPADILPYDRGLVANTYRLESVLEGTFTHTKFLAAHWVIRDGEVLPTARRQEGASYTLRLQDYQARPDLEGERLAMEVEEVLLPLFFDQEETP